MHFIGFLIIGLIAGYLAERIMRGQGAGLVINLIVGVIGAYLGGWLFGLWGLQSPGIIWSLITATIGAVILLFVVGLFKRS
jgi:uncharacterized membrane protein YeaQ/YmgE (transglycosylase-associated protein family)